MQIRLLRIGLAAIAAASLHGCGEKQDATANTAAPGAGAAPVSAVNAGGAPTGKGAPVSAAPEPGLNPGYGGPANGGVGAKAGGK